MKINKIILVPESYQVLTFEYNSLKLADIYFR